MSTINPNTLYSQNQGIFNARPYADHAAALQANKYAKDDALNKYYSNLGNVANDKGTRDIDIPVIHQKVAIAQQYWLQHPNAIKKVNTPEWYNHQKLVRDVQGAVIQSQNEQAAALKRAALRGNPANDWMFSEPDFLSKEQNASLSISDPNHESFNITSFKPKPYDTKNDFEGFTGNNSIKPIPDVNVPVRYEPVPNDKFNSIPITTNKLSDEDVNKVLSAGASKLHGVGGHAFGEYLKTLDPDSVKIMGDNFSKATGKPVTTNEDVAAAYLYSRVAKNIGETRGKPVLNKEGLFNAANAAKKEAATVSFGRSMKKIAANKQAGIPNDDLGYVSDSVADEVGENITIKEKGVNVEKRVIYTDKVDPARLDIISGRDLGKKKLGVDPIPIKQEKDGTLRYGYYQDLGTGDWTGDNNQTISRERVKDDYMATKANTKFKVQTGTKGSENTKGKVPTKTTSSIKKGKYD